MRGFPADLPATQSFECLQVEPAQPQGVGDHRHRAEAHGGGGDHRAQQQARRTDRARPPRSARRARCRRRRRTGSGGCCAWSPRLRRRARTMPRRSPFTSVTPALSMATSVPVPMAMPTSAWASAGASLMPSPAIATMRPSACRRFTRSLFSGQRLRRRPRRCRASRATASAVARLSPVSMTTRMPSACRALIASGVEALIGSATPEPAGVGRRRRRTSPFGPSRRSASAAPAAVARLDAELAVEERGVAESPLLAVDRAGDALAGDRLEVLDRSASGEPCSLRAPTMAAASGCSLPRSRLAASAEQLVGHVAARTALTVGQPRLAFGQRAGLVDDERVDLFRGSRAPRRS